MAAVLELFRTSIDIDAEMSRAIRNITSADGVQPAGFYVDAIDGRLWLLFTADDAAAATVLQERAARAGLPLKGAGIFCIPTKEESDAAMEDFFARG